MKKKETAADVLPAYIQEADSAVARLQAMGSTDDVAGLCIFRSRLPKQGTPDRLVYDRTAAWGTEKNIVESLIISMKDKPVILKIITTAWSTYMLENITPRDSDPSRQDLRRSLLAYLNQSPDHDPATSKEDAEKIFRLVRAKITERAAQITAYEKYIKEYRKAGLRDIAMLMHQEVTRLRNEITADESRAEAERLESNRLRQQMQEVGRVRQQKIAEQQELLRLEHDYDSMGRRIRNYRAMIDRLTSEMEALQQEQRDLQQRNPQFDPNSAAKKKRQQLAERKRERAARKKKGKESLPDTTRSCSPMLRRQGL